MTVPHLCDYLWSSPLRLQVSVCALPLFSCSSVSVTKVAQHSLASVTFHHRMRGNLAQSWLLTGRTALETLQKCSRPSWDRCLHPWWSLCTMDSSPTFLAPSLSFYNRWIFNDLCINNMTSKDSMSDRQLLQNIGSLTRQVWNFHWLWTEQKRYKRFLAFRTSLVPHRD